MKSTVKFLSYPYSRYSNNLILSSHIYLRDSDDYNILVTTLGECALEVNFLHGEEEFELRLSIVGGNIYNNCKIFKGEKIIKDIINYWNRINNSLNYPPCSVPVPRISYNCCVTPTSSLSGEDLQEVGQVSVTPELMETLFDGEKPSCIDFNRLFRFFNYVEKYG